MTDLVQVVAAATSKAAGMSRPRLALADIFRQHGPDYRTRHRLPLPHLRVMRAIETCRTAVLGGHVETCGHLPTPAHRL
jgi:Transposase zinc-binding domain